MYRMERGRKKSERRHIKKGHIIKEDGEIQSRRLRIRGYYKEMRQLREREED